jgi:hypothetical protein
VSTLPSRSRALGALTAELVDYAGLFPPAALDMHSAVANYAGYRVGPDAAMLGRFVVPVARLGEWHAAMASISVSDPRMLDGWRLSALLSSDHVAECAAVQVFNDQRPFGAMVDALEGKCDTPVMVRNMAAAVPQSVTLYCELPWQSDVASLVDAVRHAGVRAKLRTGGVTPELIPPPDAVVRFLRACYDQRVPCKATAGLHHPIRGLYPLTYDAGSAQAMMYGYLNVFLAAAAIADGASDARAIDVLLLTDATQLGWLPDGVSITLDGKRLTLSTAALRMVRETGAIAFGSCSFREPVDELVALVGA